MEAHHDDNQTTSPPIVASFDNQLLYSPSSSEETDGSINVIDEASTTGMNNTKEPNNNNHHHQEEQSKQQQFRLSTKSSRIVWCRKILGLLCILVVVIMWVLGGEVIQLIYSDMNYEKPFLVTFISTSLFSVYLLGFIFIGSWRRPMLKSLSWLLRASLNCCLPKRWCERMGMTPIHHYHHPRRVEYTRVVDSTSNGSSDGGNGGGIISDGGNDSSNDEGVRTRVTSGGDVDVGAGADVGDGDVNVGKTFRLAVVVTFFWFFSNTAYNYALLYTSVASDTIISNTSCLFTFLVGLLIGVETNFSVLRFISILVTLSGVALVTLSDSNHNGTGMKTDTVLGNVLSLFAAMGYGVYSSILKKYEENVSMAMMFGFVGILNLIFNWPIIFILWGLEVEVFELPSWRIFLATIVNSLISAVLSDLLWALAIVLTSPVIATVGLTLTIPFAIVCDMLIRSDFSAFNVMYAFGTIFVLFGFIAVNMSYYLPKRVRKYDQPFFCSVSYLVQKVKPIYSSHHTDHLHGSNNHLVQETTIEQQTSSPNLI